MKRNVISSFLLVTLLSQCQISYAAGERSGTPLNLPNEIEPGTDGFHITWNCDKDPMGCQNMCYYFYCLGRTNMWTKVPENDKYKTTNANRGGSGMKFNSFYPQNREIYNTEVFTADSNVSDECPPASSLQGGEGAALIGHSTWQRECR
ncbi:hypothetical protein BU16DRAFT_169499 [Lophium mytilinum]|uniref:Fibronectin type-III domain-containing protein n=1 Tax=Lophium mytilinum TaxID=390894 RepID=A0A6A6QCE7_9PEZI|nr:hypothetical protein BU16DRAFT_169499 [Lophium mytilinum]